MQPLVGLAFGTERTAQHPIEQRVQSKAVIRLALIGAVCNNHAADRELLQCATYRTVSTNEDLGHTVARLSL